MKGNMKSNNLCQRRRLQHCAMLYLYTWFALCLWYMNVKKKDVKVVFTLWRFVSRIFIIKNTSSAWLVIQMRDLSFEIPSEQKQTHAKVKGNKWMHCCAIISPRDEDKKALFCQCSFKWCISLKKIDYIFDNLTCSPLMLIAWSSMFIMLLCFI